MTEPSPAELAAAEIRDFADTVAAVRREVARVVVGHSDTLDAVLAAFFAGGHVLVEGVPGIGKTLLARAVAEALGLSLGRIQFTVDLMPADVTGTRIVEDGADGRRTFRFVPGPLFAHVVLADEVNRATPRTQSALLEAMAEEQVTVAGTTHALPAPFFVLATLNPIEMEGTYRLPEAQLDRFLFKVVLGYPSQDELERIVGSTTGADVPRVRAVLSADDAPARTLALRRLVRRVLVAPHVERYVATLVRATLPGPDGDPEVTRWVAYGASPRAGQALALGARVRALLDGRAHVTTEDVDRVALPALRHRLVLNFAAETAGIDAATLVDHVRRAAARSRA